MILVLLAQAEATAAATATAVDPVVVEKVATAAASIWTPELIAAIATAVVTVLTAIGGLFIQVLKIKKGVEKTHDLAETQDTAKLRRLNDMSTKLADATQDPVDIAVSEATEEELRARLEQLAAKGRRKEDTR